MKRGASALSDVSQLGALEKWIQRAKPPPPPPQKQQKITHGGGGDGREASVSVKEREGDEEEQKVNDVVVVGGGQPLAPAAAVASPLDFEKNRVKTTKKKNHSTVDLFLFRSFLPHAQASNLFAALLKIEYNSQQQSRVFINNAFFNIPRQQVAFGTGEYSFSGVTVHARPWAEVTELVLLRDYLHAKLGVLYSYVLVNLYVNGTNHIGWHSDDERDLDTTAPIASVSLGATRRFLLRDKQEHYNNSKGGGGGKGEGEKYDLQLTHNSLLVMGKNVQKVFQHSVHFNVLWIFICAPRYQRWQRSKIRVST